MYIIVGEKAAERTSSPGHEDLRDRVRGIVGDALGTPLSFTDALAAPLDDAILDGLEEISLLSGEHEEPYSLVLEAGVSIYTITLTWGSPLYVTRAFDHHRKIYLDPTSTLTLSRENRNWRKTTGPPWAFYPVGFGQVGVYPEPADSGRHLELLVATLPPMGNDYPHLLEKFTWAVAYYAAYQVLLEMRRIQEAVGMFHVFADRVSEAGIDVTDLRNRVPRLKGGEKK